MASSGSPDAILPSEAAHEETAPLTAFSGLLDSFRNFVVLAGTKKPKVLVFTDKELFKHGDVFAQQRHGTTAIKVAGWSDLLAKLEKFVEIERLVMFFHGNSGQLTVGKDLMDLSENNLTQGRKIPRIVRIELEGCEIATGPERLVKFARAMKAEGMAQPPVIVAYDHPYVPNLWTFSVARGETAQSIEQKEDWKRYNGYWMADPPRSSASIAGRPGPLTLGTEWFHPKGKKELPKVGELARTDFRRRSSAQDKRIHSDTEALELREFYAAWPGGPVSPSTWWPLQRVIVELP